MLTGLNTDEAADWGLRTPHTRIQPQHPGAGRRFEPPPAASHPRELPTELSLSPRHQPHIFPSLAATSSNQLNIVHQWANSGSFHTPLGPIASSLPVTFFQVFYFSTNHLFLHAYFHICIITSSRLCAYTIYSTINNHTTSCCRFPTR